MTNQVGANNFSEYPFCNDEIQQLHVSVLVRYKSCLHCVLSHVQRQGRGETARPNRVVGRAQSGLYLVKFALNLSNIHKHTHIIHLPRDSSICGHPSTSTSISTTAATTSTSTSSSTTTTSTSSSTTFNHTCHTSTCSISSPRLVVSCAACSLRIHAFHRSKSLSPWLCCCA